MWKISRPMYIGMTTIKSLLEKKDYRKKSSLVLCYQQGRLFLWGNRGSASHFFIYKQIWITIQLLNMGLRDAPANKKWLFTFSIHLHDGNYRHASEWKKWTVTFYYIEPPLPSCLQDLVEEYYFV